MTEPPPCDEGLLEFATHVVAQTAPLAMTHFNSASLQVHYKPDGTEVTEADRAIEQQLRDQLAAQFPSDAVFGEEHGGQLAATGRTWVIDPIDGTRGFVRGVPLFATLLSAVDEHGPVLGVIGLPALSHVLAAGRGRGCWLGGHRTEVSAHSQIDGALVNTSDYCTFDQQQFSSLRSQGAMLRTWGDAYGYFLVATGRAEVMIDPVCETWDLAPMPVVLAEAGGRFTDFDGANSFTSRCGVATNGLIHDDVLRCLQQPAG